MLNQSIIVGELVSRPSDLKLLLALDTIEIKLKVTRPYRNALSGEYDSDVIPLTINKDMALQITTYAFVGSLIGVKASVRNDRPDNQIYLSVDKMTFISAKEAGGEDNEES